MRQYIWDFVDRVPYRAAQLGADRDGFHKAPKTPKSDCKLHQRTPYEVRFRILSKQFHRRPSYSNSSHSRYPRVPFEHKRVQDLRTARFRIFAYENRFYIAVILLFSSLWVF